MRIKMIFLCNEALSRIFFDGGGKGDGEIAFVEDDSNFFFSSEMEMMARRVMFKRAKRR